GYVACLAGDGSTLYVGGRFTVLGGQARSSLGAVDEVTGQVLPFDPNVQPAPGGSNPTVQAIALNGGDLLLGGDFWRVGGQNRRGLGAVDAANGVLRPWNPRPAGSSWQSAWQVNAIVPGASGIGVGGRFSIMGGVDRAGAAAMDLVTGAILPWQPAISVPA